MIMMLKSVVLTQLRKNLFWLLYSNWSSVRGDTRWILAPWQTGKEEQVWRPQKSWRGMIPAVRLQIQLMLLSRDMDRLVTLRAPVLVSVRVIMKIPFQRNSLLWDQLIKASTTGYSEVPRGRLTVRRGICNMVRLNYALNMYIICAIITYHYSLMSFMILWHSTLPVTELFYSVI